MRALSTLAALFLFSIPAAATINSVTVVSPAFHTITNNATANPLIYAGMTDAISNCSSTTTGCDSCAAQSTALSSSDYTTANGPLCSVMEVGPSTNLVLLLNATPSAALTNAYFTAYISGTALTGWSTNLAGPSTSYSAAAGSNLQVTFTIPFSQICGNFATTADATCKHSSAPTSLIIGWGTSASSTSATESATVTIYFRYVNSITSTGSATSPWATWGGANAYAGFYNFNVFPGDAKVYINNPKVSTTEGYVVPDFTTGTTSPSAADVSGIAYSGIRVLYYQASSTDTGSFAVNSSYADLAFSTGSSSLSPQTVSGLQDLTGTNEYQFAIASMDQAGILTYWTNPTSLNFSLTPTGQTQAAQPQPVYGVLDGKGCFIASAAYGSVLEPQVSSFRNFRDLYLAKSHWGQKFINWYYQASPPAANFIWNHQGARVASQIMLLPALGFVRLALLIGPLWASLVIVTSLTGFIFLLVIFRRRHLRGRL